MNPPEEQESGAGTGTPLLGEPRPAGAGIGWAGFVPAASAARVLRSRAKALTRPRLESGKVTCLRCSGPRFTEGHEAQDEAQGPRGRGQAAGGRPPRAARRLAAPALPSSSPAGGDRGGPGRREGTGHPAPQPQPQPSPGRPLPRPLPPVAPPPLCGGRCCPGDGTAPPRPAPGTPMSPRGRPPRRSPPEPPPPPPELPGRRREPRASLRPAFARPGLCSRRSAGRSGRPARAPARSPGSPAAAGTSPPDPAWRSSAPPDPAVDDTWRRRAWRGTVQTRR